MKISSTSSFCSLCFPICQGAEEEEILGEAVVKVDEDIEVRGGMNVEPKGGTSMI